MTCFAKKKGERDIRLFSSFLTKDETQVPGAYTHADSHVPRHAPFAKRAWRVEMSSQRSPLTMRHEAAILVALLVSCAPRLSCATRVFTTEEEN